MKPKLGMDIVGASVTGALLAVAVSADAAAATPHNTVRPAGPPAGRRQARRRSTAATQAARTLQVDLVSGRRILAALSAPSLELSYGTGDRPGGSRLVRDLQRLLARVGDAPGPIDGRFGPLTEWAVRSFQAARGLPVDGIAGPRTLGELTARTLMLAPGAGYEPGGSRLVRGLQQLLARAGESPGPIDGRFGPLTEAAVRRFQADRGMEANGVAGPSTIAALAPRPTHRPARASGPTRVDRVRDAAAGVRARTVPAAVRDSARSRASAHAAAASPSATHRNRGGSLMVALAVALLGALLIAVLLRDAPRWEERRRRGPPLPLPEMTGTTTPVVPRQPDRVAAAARSAAARQRPAYAVSERPRPEHAVLERPRPEHAVAARLRPEHIVPARPRPDHIVTLRSWPDHIVAGRSRPDHAVSARPQPEHIVAERPQPAYAIAERPQPAYAIAERPQPAYAIAERPQPAVAVAECAQPAVAAAERPWSDPAVTARPRPDCALQRPQIHHVDPRPEPESPPAGGPSTRPAALVGDDHARPRHRARGRGVPASSSARPVIAGTITLVLWLIVTRAVAGHRRRSSG
jgi:peptidoglycan hydrolase-like protein with peptidoglycan-binding domain